MNAKSAVQNLLSSALGALDRPRRALAATTPSRADIEAAIADARAEAARAATAYADLAARRHAILVGGSDDDLAAHDAEAAREARSRDRAEALGVELQSRLEDLAAREAAAEKDRRRREIEEKDASAVKALRSYPEAAAGIIAIIRAVAEADHARDRFKDAYPAEPLPPGAERQVRMSQRPTAEIVETEVLVWCFLDSVRHLPEEDVAKVQTAGRPPGYGFIRNQRGPDIEVEQRRFRRIETVTFPPEHGAPLSEAIHLPSLHYRDRAMWPGETSHPAAVLARLAEPFVSVQAAPPRTDVVFRVLPRDPEAAVYTPRNDRAATRVSAGGDLSGVAATAFNYRLGA